MRRGDVADELAARFESRWLAGYVRWKVRTDPIYEIVRQLLAATTAPLVDLGCGMGLLSLYLHASGDSRPAIGIDHDARKIDSGVAVARAAGANMTFHRADVREPQEATGNVLLLDVLHYFSAQDQAAILRNAARSTERGALLIIRDCLRDRSWRYYVTAAQERFSKTIGWLRGERLRFPTRDEIATLLLAEGLEIVEVRPLWFKTPFNNYLLVFRRP